jgi:acetylornithine deacetylase
MSPTSDAHRPDGTIGSAVAVLERLIAFPSVSDTSNLAITDWCAATLDELGFELSRTEYEDSKGVRKANLVAVRQPAVKGNDQSGLAYFCHTDVVPAMRWDGHSSNPFQALQKDDRIYGRGTCDMKGSLAVMLSALARVDPQEQRAPVWVVCTADEEVGFTGAKHIVENCEGYRDLVQVDPVSIIGEPTELNVVYAHKGIRGVTFHSRGRAGHSATGFGINANEAMVPMLSKLLELCHRTRNQSDLQDDRFDPPTLSWNFGVSDHSHVVNITPERCDAWVSLRTMPEITGESLITEAEETARSLGLTVCRMDGCDAIWNAPESDFILQLQSLAGTETQTVCYATDGGVLNELSRRVVIGPGSIEQAHTVNEWISIDQLRRGIDCYEKAIRHWCT